MAAMNRSQTKKTIPLGPVVDKAPLDGAGIAPGFGSSQAQHFSWSALFVTMQVPHTQSPGGFWNSVERLGRLEEVLGAYKKFIQLELFPF